ncbi:hypothetical protein BC962_3133 [Gillisia mitskevichiae]|uniref:Uncharacterized protein n=1 Tax=Gillisia mitskevichiae TaxID=270921 RepID=A0A495NXU0_9FLAO|nr:DUF6452 family protein [Gillisia mitskevichiae]RKS42676.1 hypothetical protein BC962_3133 [Gillisia mitskevichiae]
MFGKKIKSLSTAGIFLLLIALINLSCQRDDICPESTLITPLVKISFYDFDANSEGDTLAKPVANFSIRAVGDTLNFEIPTNPSEISIPLKTDVDLTSYEFILNANDDEEEEPTSAENSDIINFTYTRNQEYINSACSFKVTYINLEAKLVAETPSSNNWIKDIIVDQSTVEDETTTHISIFH